MLSARCYATVARISALLLGAGSLSWSASNPERVRVLLGECSGRYTVGPTTDCPDCGHRLQWNGCDVLARELGVSGALLVLGGLPARHPEEG
jgi:hypothetical protein